MRFLTLIITFMLFTWMSLAHAMETNAQIWGSYGSANHEVDRALLGASHKLDDKWDGYISINVAESAGDDHLYVAWVRGKGLINEYDYLMVGRQDIAYKGAMENWLGTRWLKPMYTQTTGLMNDRDDGITYGGKYEKLNYALQMMEKMEGDAHDAYSLLLKYKACEWANVLLAGEMYAQDSVYLVGLQMKHSGVKLALEYGVEQPDEGDGTSSYAGTLAYSHPSGVGAYANYVTGDDEFKVSRAMESEMAVAVTYKASDNVSVALAHYVRSYDGAEDDELTKAMIAVEL